MNDINIKMKNKFGSLCLLIILLFVCALKSASSLENYVDVFMIIDQPPYMYCELFRDGVDHALSNLETDILQKYKIPVNIRMALYVRYRKDQEYRGVYDKISKVKVELIDKLYKNCNNATNVYNEYVLDFFQNTKADSIQNYQDALDNEGIYIALKSSLKNRVEWTINIFKNMVFNENTIWDETGKISDFWSKDNVRLVLYNTYPWGKATWLENRDPIFGNEQIIGGQFLRQEAAKNHITVLNITGIQYPSTSTKNTLNKIPDADKKKKDSFHCSIVPFYDTNVEYFYPNLIKYFVSSTINPFYTNDTQVTSVEKHTSLNKHIEDDVSLTYKDCLLKALNLDISVRAIIAEDNNVLDEIKNRFKDVHYSTLDGQKIKFELNNPYKKDLHNEGVFFIYSNGTAVRKQAPNFFNFGKIDLLNILHSNKKKVLTDYPNDVARKSNTGEINRILAEKIRKTSDLVSGGNSFIECSSLIFANKLASNAYIVAKDYIQDNAKYFSIDQLTRPMYVEPVFIMSAAQASYCNLIRDEHSILKHHFINPNYTRCPYVYVIMYITYSNKLDSITGLPVPKVNFDFKYDACEDRPNLTVWIPKKSCISPDPYNLPFGLRTSLKNVRVINIIDILKSEDNLRNINYSLSIRSLPSTNPDDLGIYTCIAKKCENHALNLIGHDYYNFLEALMPTQYQEQPHLDQDIGCALDEEVLPENYSEFNIRPFKVATEEEIINILTTDADHVYSTMPINTINQRVNSLQYGLWDLVKPNLNRHKYITDITSDMSQYNIENCYARMWSFNSTLNGSSDFERSDVNVDRLILSNILPINGRPMIGMSYSPFIDDVM